MTEKQVQESGNRWLQQQGAVCIKQSTMRRYGTRGWPDYLVLGIQGVVFWIEYKRPGGRLIALQERRIEELRRLGQHVYVCQSKEEVQKAWWHETS